MNKLLRTALEAANMSRVESGLIVRGLKRLRLDLSERLTALGMTNSIGQDSAVLAYLHSEMARLKREIEVTDRLIEQHQYSSDDESVG